MTGFFRWLDLDGSPPWHRVFEWAEDRVLAAQDAVEQRAYDGRLRDERRTDRRNKRADRAVRRLDHIAATVRRFQ